MRRLAFASVAVALLLAIAGGDAIAQNSLKREGAPEAAPNAPPAQPAAPGTPSADAVQFQFNDADADVWARENDDAIRHVQSGLVCPAKLGSAALWRGVVFPSAQGRGGDVGCDYARIIDNAADVKLTIFAIKAEPGTTLETAFDKYRAEMHTAYPNGTNARPSVRMTGEVPATFPRVLSEEIDVVIEGRPYNTEVIVMLISGWVIEIRSTRPTSYVPNDPNMALDLMNSNAALMQAVSSVGTPI
jgi:hypothetical protein